MLLEQRLVGDIKGQFRIEAYQRGYRWSKDEIEHLLNDIHEIPDGQSYCLQPVVVKEVFVNSSTKTDVPIYELIDGQQRLTTLFLIMKFLRDYIDLRYGIEYVTRKTENGHVGSKELLDNIENCNLNAPSSNIDELFIKKAYSIITKWFESWLSEEKKVKMKFATKLQEKVSVIWYEVDENEDGTSIFTRLNIGKISLTNAELVKALFLSRKKDIKDVTHANYTSNVPGIDDKKQHEIALEWDKMEKGLHDEKFWAFITNAKAEKYPIRMEMLFDIIEKKPSDEDDYYTFNSFCERFKDAGDDKYKTWETVVRYYQQLQEWYKDFDLYHQIGFLVAQDEDIKQLLDMALSDTKPMLKSEFKKEVVEKIRRKMVFERIKGQLRETIDYADLNYEDHSDFIQTLLLLFNVETIRQKGDENNRFPFDRYKNQGIWSLEHIHAQNSDSLKTNKDWRNWLTDHRKSLVTIKEELENVKQDEKTKGKIDDINQTISAVDDVVSHIDKNLGGIRDKFNPVAKKVVDILSDGNDMSQMHSLSNMALLTVGENAALKNSTFDVKRVKIIDMDKKGEYIPACTRNVFMKYYSDSNTGLHFWSENDRKSYIDAINKVLFHSKNANGKEQKLIKSKIIYGKQQQNPI